MMNPTMNEHPPAMPPVPVPQFLQSAPCRVWCSAAGLWFLRSEALQTGGILRRADDPSESRWILYTPTDFDQWADILQRIADDLEALARQPLQNLPAANLRPA